jgi:hypothetical protein
VVQIQPLSLVEEPFDGPGAGALYPAVAAYWFEEAAVGRVGGEKR